jgi:hypothetical protein
MQQKDAPAAVQKFGIHLATLQACSPALVQSCRESMLIRMRVPRMKRLHV